MDIRNFDIRPIVNKLPIKRMSDEFINSLNLNLRWIEHEKQPEQSVRIYYGGAFGVMRAARISSEGEDFLSIAAEDSNGAMHKIVAPVSQCSFMFSVFTPTAEEPASERVVFGFGKADKDES